MRADDPTAALRKWRDHGAGFRVLVLTPEKAVVELRTCFGEPVDRLESSDPGFIRYLEEVEGEEED